HRQRAHPGGGQLGGVPGQQDRLGRQRDPGGQQELAAAQQVRRIRQLEHVHPADLRGQAVRPGHHPRTAPPEKVEVQEVGEGRKHETKSKCRTKNAYTLSVHSQPRDPEDWGPCLSFSPAIARLSRTGSVSTTTSRSRSSAARAAGSPTPRVAATSTSSPASSPTCSATTSPRSATRSSGRSPAASCTPRRCT